MKSMNTGHVSAFRDAFLYLIDIDMRRSALHEYPQRFRYNIQ